MKIRLDPPLLTRFVTPLHCQLLRWQSVHSPHGANDVPPDPASLCRPIHITLRNGPTRYGLDRDFQQGGAPAICKDIQQDPSHGMVRARSECGGTGTSKLKISAQATWGNVLQSIWGWTDLERIRGADRISTSHRLVGGMSFLNTGPRSIEYYVCVVKT